MRFYLVDNDLFWKVELIWVSSSKESAVSGITWKMTISGSYGPVFVLTTDVPRLPMGLRPDKFIINRKYYKSKMHLTTSPTEHQASPCPWNTSAYNWAKSSHWSCTASCDTRLLAGPQVTSLGKDSSSNSKYSWPLNNARAGDADPHAVENLHITFDSPQNLSSNSPLSIGSLTDNINSRLTHTLYVILLYTVFFK